MAPTKVTAALVVVTPSSRESSWVFRLVWWAASESLRLRITPSISSKQTTLGASLVARPKRAARILSSPEPLVLDRGDRQVQEHRVALLAIAFAIMVLPVPGAPQRIPRLGSDPHGVVGEKNSGTRIGSTGHHVLEDPLEPPMLRTGPRCRRGAPPHSGGPTRAA